MKPTEESNPILSSSQAKHLGDSEGRTNQAIQYFWGRICEKFDRITKAFRYFDVHSVTFPPYILLAWLCILQRLQVLPGEAGDQVDRRRNLLHIQLHRQGKHPLNLIQPLERGRRDQFQGVLPAQRGVQDGGGTGEQAARLGPHKLQNGGQQKHILV